MDNDSSPHLQGQEIMASPRSYMAEEEKEHMPSNNIEFNLNVDELVSNLDVDVPLESVEPRGEEELKFQKDDS